MSVAGSWFKHLGVVALVTAVGALALGATAAWAAPPAPTVTGTSPASPANNNSPKVVGSALAGTTVEIYKNEACSGAPLATGTAAAFASPGITVSVADNTTTTFYATATDGTGTSACSSPGVTYVEDSKAPAPPTFNWTQPASPSSKTSLTVGGSAVNGTTVKLYSTTTCTGSPLASGSAFTFRSPGLATTVAKNTTTTYRATTTDAAGNTSSCSSATQKFVNAEASILFEGSALSDFEYLQECAEGRITEVPDPLGSGRTVMAFAPHDTDVAGTCPNENATEYPRATAISPDLIEDGDEFWLRTRMLVPNGFGEFENPSWMTLVSVYGEPFEGTSPWRIEIRPIEDPGVFYGDYFSHSRNATYGWDLPWFNGDSPYGHWVEFLLHEKFSENGYVEEWFNGEQETFFGELSSNPGKADTTKLEMATMDESNDGGPNSIRIGQYRAAEEFEPQPVYYEFVKVGTTKASVGG